MSPEAGFYQQRNVPRANVATFDVSRAANLCRVSFWRVKRAPEFLTPNYGLTNTTLVAECLKPFVVEAR